MTFGFDELTIGGFDKLSFESEPEGSSLRVDDTTGGGEASAVWKRKRKRIVGRIG